MANFKGWLKTGVVGDSGPDFRGEAHGDYAVIARRGGECLVLVCADKDAWVAWAAADGLVVYLSEIGPDAGNEVVAEAQAMGSDEADVRGVDVPCDVE
jgi:hypothetical protein